MSRIYHESYHECGTMPDTVRILKDYFGDRSVFTFEHVDHAPDGHTVSHDTTTFFEFKFCPYCGERLVDE